jgi:hypothetical protein
VKSGLPIYRAELHSQVEVVTCTSNNTEWLCCSVLVPSCLVRSYLVSKKDGFQVRIMHLFFLNFFIRQGVDPIAWFSTVSVNPLLIEISCTSSTSSSNTPHCCQALVQNLHPLQGSWSNATVGRYSGQDGNVSVILDSPSALVWFFPGRCCMTILYWANSSIHLASCPSIFLKCKSHIRLL